MAIDQARGDPLVAGVRYASGQAAGQVRQIAHRASEHYAPTLFAESGVFNGAKVACVRAHGGEAGVDPEVVPFHR